MSEKGTLQESPSQTYVEWTINMACINLQDSDYVDSPFFLLSDTKLNLRIYPKGKLRDRATGSVTVLILIGKNLKRDYEIQYTIGVKDTNDSVFMSNNFKSTFNTLNIGPRNPVFYLKTTLETSTDIINSDGSLTLFFNARVANDMETSEQNSTQTPCDGTMTLSENLKDLYIGRQFNDATIVVQGREFFVHKSILATRSSVFLSMFESNMIEKSSGKVEIFDCDPDSFEDFLLFLYTGKFDMVSSSNALLLYKTADKYDTKELREKCVICMTSELSVDSVCDVVHLAATYNESDLLKDATKFFISNAEAIVKTIKWQTFLVENIALGNELILKFIQNKTKE